MSRYLNPIKHSIIVLIILSACQLHGQSIAKSDYLVTLEQDTLYGKISINITDFTPSSIRFQLDTIDINVGVNDLRSFYNDGKMYHSEFVRIDRSKYITSKIYLNQLTYLDQPIISEEQVFLEVIFTDDDLTLYKFVSSDSKEHFLIRKANNEIVSLYNNQYKKEVKGEVVMAYSNRYKDQLPKVLVGCMEISKLIDNLSYNEEQFTQLMSNYLECLQEGRLKSKVKYKKKIDEASVEFGAVAGVSYSDIDFSSQFNPLLDIDNFSAVIAPTLGVSLNIVLPARRKKFSVNNDVLLKFLKTDASTSLRVNSTDSTYAEVELDFSLIRVSHMLRYKWLGEKWDLFANIGFSNSLILKKESKIVETRTFLGQVFESEGEVLPSFNTHELGVLVGVGIDFGNFVGEIRYEQSEGVTNNFAVDSVVNTFNILATYYF